MLSLRLQERGPSGRHTYWHSSIVWQDNHLQAGGADVALILLGVVSFGREIRLVLESEEALSRVTRA